MQPNDLNVEQTTETNGKIFDEDKLSALEEVKPVTAKEFLDHANTSAEDIPTPRKEPIGFPEFLDIVLFLYTRNQDIINIDACKALGASKFASLPNVRVTADYGVIKTCHEVYNGIINGTICGVDAGIFERLIYQSPIQTDDDVIEWCNYLMSCFGCELLLVDQSRSPHFQSLVKEHKKTIAFTDFHDRKIKVLLHIDKCVLELRLSVDDGTIRHVYYVVSRPAMEIFNDMVESCPTRSSSLGELCNIFQTVYNDRKLEDGYNRRPTGRR